MDPLQAVLVAIIQGATELFPVSSLGHAVVLPALFGWNVSQRSDAFLPFLVLLHAGTALALLLYFWRDWLAIGLGIVGLSGRAAARDSRRLFLLIVVATIPAVIAGFVFNKFFRDLFAVPMVAAGFLVVNGFMLLLGEKLRAAGGIRPIGTLTITDALFVGVCQCAALFPGISRSGATIVGGLLRGVDHESSAHFSFLIALPVIVGATTLEVPKLLHMHLEPGTLSLAAICAVVAGIAAFLSTWGLMRYFRAHDQWALSPFAIYCMVLGAGAIAILAIA